MYTAPSLPLGWLSEMSSPSSHPSSLPPPSLHHTHTQCAEKYTPIVFPFSSSHGFSSLLLLISFPTMISEKGLGVQGNSFPSASSITIDRPSAVINWPFSVFTNTSVGIPLTLNLRDSSACNYKIMMSATCTATSHLNISRPLACPSGKDSDEKLTKLVA